MEAILAILAIAAVVGLIFGAILFLRGGLLGGCLAVMVAGTCFSVPFQKLGGDSLPLSADRLLLGVLVIQYIFWRRWGWVDVKPIEKPEILLIVFLGIMTFSTFRADWTINGYKPLSWLVIYYFMPAAIYWIARQERYTERKIHILFGCLAAFGIYLSITSLAEYFKAWWLVFPQYIATDAASPDASFVGRGRGPLLNPVANGILLCTCLSGVLMAWPRLNRPKQLVLMAVALLCLAAMYATLTRSVWMSAALTLALIVGLALPWNWRLPLLGGALLAGLLLATTQWENLLAFKRDDTATAQETADSVHLRSILAEVAWQMFCDRPILGCGYGQYDKEHINYLSDRSSDLPLERARVYSAHNVFFSLLTETGLVGLGAFLTLVFFWARDAWRLWANTALPLETRQAGLLFLVVVCVYFLNGFFHDVSVQNMMNMTLFFFAGVTAGLRTASPQKS
jgi:O-antigen ligase